MTKEERLKFVEDVKGKKIKKTFWPEGDYFVPNGGYSLMPTLGLNMFEGDLFEGGILTSPNRSFSIEDGLVSVWSLVAEPQEKAYTAKVFESKIEGCSHPKKYINKAGGKRFWVCPDCKKDLGDAE